MQSGFTASEIVKQYNFQRYYGFDLIYVFIRDMLFQKDGGERT